MENSEYSAQNKCGDETCWEAGAATGETPTLAISAAVPTVAALEAALKLSGLRPLAWVLAEIQLTTTYEKESVRWVDAGFKSEPVFTLAMLQQLLQYMNSALPLATVLTTPEIASPSSLPKFRKEDSLGSQSPEEIKAYLDSIEKFSDSLEGKGCPVHAPPQAKVICYYMLPSTETKYIVECPFCFAQHAVNTMEYRSGKQLHECCSSCYKEFIYHRAEQ